MGGSSVRCRPAPGSSHATPEHCIVPVASWGSERVIPRGKWLPRPADVELRIGEPFHLPSRGRDGRPLTSREAAAIMMERVIALLPRERRPVGADMRTLGGSSPAA